MKTKEEKAREKVFYELWEKFVENMTDEQLEASLYMQTNFNEIVNLVREEHAYRNCKFED